MAGRELSIVSPEFFSFDRMLVAQCQAEGLRLVSNNRQLAAYGVDLLW